MRKRLTDIADIERAVSGKEYPPGTVYIQVSARAAEGREQFHRLKYAGKLESKYAAVIPHEGVNQSYLYHLCNEFAGPWAHKFIGEAINISMELFKFLTVNFEPDETVQEKYATLLDLLLEQIEMKEEMRKHYNELLKFSNSTMMSVIDLPEQKKKDDDTGHEYEQMTMF